MNEIPYLEREKRKTILLLSDDIRLYSGVATMSREIVTKTASYYNWYQVGAAVEHSQKGKLVDISEEVNQMTGLKDSSVKLLPYSGYGDAPLLRKLLKEVKPDAIFIFTDPRYWKWLFAIEREVRSKVPIIWLNIWDNYPAPLYNRDFYRSVDALFAISQQTKVINELVLGEEAQRKIIKYIPHGVDETVFFPIEKESEIYPAFEEFKKNIFQGKEIDFVVFWNSRNLSRKRPADVILAYRHFCDSLPKEEAKRCALVMHTEVVSNAGTDLIAVKNALCDPEYVNIYFSTERLLPSQMNLLYNLADVNVLISSNEGWGLSLTESMMAGTMNILNVTGGMQDQARFQNEEGEWLQLSSEVPSNHRATYKRCGEWTLPVFPSNISLSGSPTTPYIFDDRAAVEEVAHKMLIAYYTPKEERDRRGRAGRAWALSSEAKMSASAMSKSIMEGIDECLRTFKPRLKYEVLHVEDTTFPRVKHELLNY